MRGTLGVRIVTPTQDRHVTKHVTGLSYESSAPGGGTTASMTLRMTRDTWPDIVGARLFIYDAATAEAMWDGWIDNPGESSTDDTESFELSAQGPIRVLRSIDGSYTVSSILLSLVGDVDSDRVRMRWIFGFADNNLDDLAVLPEILISSKRFQQLVFLRSRAQTCHINKVLLHHSQAGQVLSAEVIGLGFLRLFL